MNEKTKKSLAVCLSSLMVLGTIESIYQYKTNINVERQMNRFIASTFLDNNYSVPNGTKYSDFDTTKETYYVLKKDNRTILSTNPTLVGYECLGMYDSKNSADAIFYYTVVSSADMVCHKVVSYDELEGKKSPLHIIDDVTLIDENAPEDVSAFIPEPSIVPITDYAKVMN